MTSLMALNTLAIPAQASEVHLLESVDALRAVTGKLRARGERPLILGGGSNVVLADRIEQPVCIIRLRGIHARTVDGGVEVTAAAGENWHDLVRWSLGQGLGGLENLALIPGSVGAAPVQNIGAYGVELAARFVAVEVLELDSGQILSMGPDEVRFGYRTSLFKEQPGRFVITALTVHLRSGSAGPERVDIAYTDVAQELERMGRTAVSFSARPVDVAEAVIRVRRRKLPDPRRVPNAGSFFKNPVVSVQTFQNLEAAHKGLKSYADPAGMRLAAAQLIDRCLNVVGDRPFWARADSPVRVWDRQALVLTNPGRASAVEVIRAARAIQNAVDAAFGIRLQMEPDVLGSLSSDLEA